MRVAPLALMVALGAVSLARTARADMLPGEIDACKAAKAEGEECHIFEPNRYEEFPNGQLGVCRLRAAGPYQWKRMLKFECILTAPPPSASASASPSASAAPSASSSAAVPSAVPLPSGSAGPSGAPPSSSGCDRACEVADSAPLPRTAGIVLAGALCASIFLRRSRHRPTSRRH